MSPRTLRAPSFVQCPARRRHHFANESYRPGVRLGALEASLRYRDADFLALILAAPPTGRPLRCISRATRRRTPWIEAQGSIRTAVIRGVCECVAPRIVAYSLTVMPITSAPSSAWNCGLETAPALWPSLGGVLHGGRPPGLASSGRARVRFPQPCR
jgi:hypothetical protein